MKRLIISCLLLLAFCSGFAQNSSGKIIVTHIHSQMLQNNGGENPDRRITVYLPPGYDATTTRYPVIYFLHGFLWSDSLLINRDHVNKVLDVAIATGKIKPVIVVFPDETTLYGGSFYTNSLFGRWADYTAKELVGYIDQHFRTINDRESRAISGHSMGGHGAIKIAMLYPDVFSCVYALSPAVMGLTTEFGPESAGFKRVQQIGTREELTGGSEFQANAVVALGRAFSPNPSKPPFYCDLPYTYRGDSLVTNEKVLALWKENLPLYMTDKYADNLRKLKAIKLDWGRNDEFAHIPITCLMFSKKLEQMGIHHYAEEYIGTHGNMLWTEDGRALNDLLPFMNRFLKYENAGEKDKQKVKIKSKQ